MADIDIPYDPAKIEKKYNHTGRSMRPFQSQKIRERKNTSA
tara:strand:+ start:215 stop:337 length:123 start_codon:yes stop_codon:yes gene_type:complete